VHGCVSGVEETLAKLGCTDAEADVQKAFRVINAN
jgi:hypothetical protein